MGFQAPALVDRGLGRAPPGARRLGCVWAPLPALGLPSGQAGPLLPLGVRGEVVDELPAGLVRGLPELIVLRGQRCQGRRSPVSPRALGTQVCACAQAFITDHCAAHWFSPPPPPPCPVAWHRARGGCPLGAGQAGPRPVVPGGRKPRQWALVPCPQALGQSLGLSATGSLSTLGAPLGLTTVGGRTRPLQGALLH